MPYTFVSSEEDYSTYRDAHGGLVYFMHREPGEVWTGVTRPGLTLGAAIEAVNAEGLHNGEMMGRFRALLLPGEDGDEATLCGGEYNPWAVGYGCFYVVYADDTTMIDNQPICEACRCEISYVYCSRCDNAVTSFDGVGGDMSDDYVCMECLPGHTQWCDHCDYRYWTNTADEHTHGECSDDCASPMQVFSIPLGEGFLSSVSELRIPGRLSNDETVTLTVGAGDERISVDGRSKIEAALIQWGYHGLGEETHGLSRNTRWSTIYSAFYANGWEWKNAMGGYTRRLRSAIYKATKSASPENKGLSVPDDVLAAIGQVAFEFSRPIEMNVAITRDLNQSASDFAHSDSCWWGSYSYSRCALKTNAGFGLRSFDNDGYVTGRAWVFPLTIEGERLVPTFGEADAYIIFNHYGALTERNGVRALSSLVGWGSRAVDFDVSESEMYVNNCSGTLLAPDAVLEDARTGSLRMPYTFEKHAELPVPSQPEPQPEPTQELAFIS